VDEAVLAGLAAAPATSPLGGMLPRTISGIGTLLPAVRPASGPKQ
jgi:hypothetical protein